jgi:uncharacterized protein YxjI
MTDRSSSPTGDPSTAGSLVAGRSGIGLHQKRKVFEMRNQYALTGEDGEAIGAVDQVGQSPFTFLARLVTGLDVVLPVTLAVTTADGAIALRLHKPWFRYRVTVLGGDGSVVGAVRKRIRLGKAVFLVDDAAGAPVGRLSAENWRARDFRFEDAGGSEAARVTKQWRGLATEVFTDADSYAVTFAATSGDVVRLLALSAALAVDLTMKQKDYGSPLDLLDPI